MLAIETIVWRSYSLIPHYIIGILYSRGSTKWMPSCSPLWFLTCLTMALLIFNVIMHIEKKKTKIIIVALCCLGSYILDLIDCVKLVWNIDTALMAVCFLGIGFVTYKNKKLLFENNWYLIFIFSSLILGMLSIYFNSYVNFDNNEYGNIVLMLTGSVFMSYALSCIIYHFHPFEKLFSFYGRHTIFIMGFDYFSDMIGSKILSIFCFDNWLSVFCVKIIIITLGIYVWYWMIHFIPNEKVQKMLRF